MINKELFLEVFESISFPLKVSLWNMYAREENPDEEIYDNDEDFFNTFYEGKPADAVRAASYGDYRYYDDYVWFNGYGNLVSANYYSDYVPICPDILYDYFNNGNEELLDEFPAFYDCIEEDEDIEEE